MHLLPKSRKRVARGLSVWVSNHYRPTLFGIRGKYESSYKSGQYVESGSPGTGFFVRNSSSRTYKAFCKGEREKLTPKYLDMVRGLEFDFDREIARVQEAQNQSGLHPAKAAILESYVNVLPLAKEAEDAERVIDGIKELSHRKHHLSSYQTHVMSSFKSKVARLGHDVRTIQMHVPELCGEERYKLFGAVVVAFSQVAASHRIWCVRENLSGLESSFSQVYFDLGIFNFIQAPLMTPLMRDAEGRRYYFYPDYLVRSVDAVDFEVYDLKDLNFLFREVPYDMVSNMVIDSYYDNENTQEISTHVHRRNYEQFGDGLLVNKDTKALNEIEEEHKLRERVVGELYVPELHLRYYVRDFKALKAFAKAMSDYQVSVMKG